MDEKKKNFDSALDMQQSRDKTVYRKQTNYLSLDTIGHQCCKEGYHRSDADSRRMFWNKVKYLKKKTSVMMMVIKM